MCMYEIDICWTAVEAYHFIFSINIIVDKTVCSVVGGL